jgi:predicted DNA-binding transcriptional regulator AlpA
MTTAGSAERARGRTEEGHVLTARRVAVLIGRSVSWFYAHRKDLERAGFPKKDRLVGGWYRTAVEDWLVKRAGTVERFAQEDERQEMRDAIYAQRARRHALRHQPTR